MSVSRKALIEWLQTEISLENLSSGESKAARWAWKMVISAIESSRFDIPSSESEGEADTRIDQARALLGNDYVIVPLAYWNSEAERYRALKVDNERLRAALVATEMAMRVMDKYGERPSNLRDVYAQADEALSTSETAVQPDKADQVRGIYEAWANMDGPAIYSPETIANIIADVAIIVGIDIPGIDPEDPFNIPGIKDGRGEA